MNEDLKKKLIKYSIILFVGLIIFIFILAFVGVKRTKITETTKNIKLNSGEKYLLEVNDYEWESSNKNVAIVNNSGEIEGIKEGKTTIKITTGNEIIIYEVEIEDIDKAVVLTNIKLEKNTIEIEKGESYNMKVSLIPDNATSTELTWYSSNSDVAVVNNGKIEGVGRGTCMVTVKSSNGYIDTCLVKVRGDETLPVEDLEEISFDTTSMVLKEDIIYTLKYEVVPKDVNGIIEWESSDNEVAIIENGVIETKNIGTTTITARSGEIEEVMYITVVEGNEDDPDVIDDGKEIKVTDVAINQEEVVLEIGEEYKLEAIIIPNNATNKDVTWTSSNPNIVTVDDYGNIKAIASGNATIILTSANQKEAKCQVAVKEDIPDAPIQEEEISLDITNVNLNVGETIKLTETITPSNTVNKVTWKSSNTKVATVNNGQVRALASGSTIITVTLPNGNYATCNINVSKNNSVVNVLALSMNVESVHLKVGGSSQLSVKVIPSNATNKTVTWTSSNSNIATVDSNGKVVGKASGTVIITARASNGVIAKATVVVENGVSIKLSKSTLEMAVGSTNTLSATVTNASSKNITWKSSNTSVATIDSNGKITAKKAGTTTITGTVQNKSATCKVTVKEATPTPTPKPASTVNTIFMGDSRTNGMKSKTNSKYDIIIAKDGANDLDLPNHISQVKTILNNNPNTTYTIVLNYGVNAYYSLDKYVNLYNEFIKSIPAKHKIIIESVNPVDDNRSSHVKNSNIVNFNSQIKKRVTGSNVKYCDVYNAAPLTTWVSQYISDGVHYTSSGYQFIYDTVKKCIGN